jgi:hypothetical protein
MRRLPRPLGARMATALQPPVATGVARTREHMRGNFAEPADGRATAANGPRRHAPFGQAAARGSSRICGYLEA